MPNFRHYLRHRTLRHHTSGVSYYPTEYAALCGVPKNAGAGTKVAVIELGGAYNQADLDEYFKSLGLSVKPVVFHSVSGAQNTSDGPDGADGEVILDLSVIGGVAPGAELHCYTAPNTDSGFLAAINQAIDDKMDAISISWGAAEDQWSPTSIQQFDAAFKRAAAAGIVVTVAAGDNGSSDGERGNHVDFPASSPNVVGCGGTSLPSTNPRTESVWNDGTRGGATGGGISSVFALPAYQPKAAMPSATHRCVPDAGGLADPVTGWKIVVDGQDMVIGGTSAVAPFLAGMVAALKSAGCKFGTLDLLAKLYAGGLCFDVTSGNNGTYTAKSGYDACTGNGVPFYAKLLAALGASAPPAPTPTPSPSPTPSAATRTIVVTGASSITIDGKAA